MVWLSPSISGCLLAIANKLFKIVLKVIALYIGLSTTTFSSLFIYIYHIMTHIPQKINIFRKKVGLSLFSYMPSSLYLSHFLKFSTLYMRQTDFSELGNDDATPTFYLFPQYHRCLTRFFPEFNYYFCRVYISPLFRSIAVFSISHFL